MAREESNYIKRRTQGYECVVDSHSIKSCYYICLYLVLYVCCCSLVVTNTNYNIKRRTVTCLYLYLLKSVLRTNVTVLRFRHAMLRGVPIHKRKCIDIKLLLFALLVVVRIRLLSQTSNGILTPPMILDIITM